MISVGLCSCERLCLCFDRTFFCLWKWVPLHLAILGKRVEKKVILRAPVQVAESESPFSPFCLAVCFLATQLERSQFANQGLNRGCGSQSPES